VNQTSIHFGADGARTDFQPTTLNVEWQEALRSLGNGEGDAFDYVPLEALKLLPRLKAQENTLDELGQYDPFVVLKFFTPDSIWTWFVLEGKKTEEDFLFFGLVKGFEDEFGYFSLSEIKESTGPLGLNIERDLHFRPQRLSRIQPEMIH
jgi:Protein of unknown function (DUF2958)